MATLNDEQSERVVSYIETLVKSQDTTEPDKWERIEKLEEQLQAMTELMINKDDFDYMKRQSSRHGIIIGELLEREGNR